jgi:hypothetical protein
MKLCKLDCWLHQSALTYVFIGGKTYLFYMDMRKYLQNKLDLDSYSDSIYLGKIDPSEIPNRNIRFLWLQL